MKYIFLLVILISIQIKASPHTENPTIESNNLNDFVFDDNDFLWDDTDLIDDSIFDDLVLHSLSYYPSSQNIRKSSNTRNEADNLLKQDIPDNNSATALNAQELESNYNEIIELTQHNFDANNSLNENIDNLAKNEVADNHNLTDESKINSTTEKDFENSENNLVHYANNSLTSTKDSTTTEFAPRRVVNNTDILISNIDNRLNSLTRSFAALAAGDEEQIYGFYINPFIGKATQKETKEISRYHSTSKGTIIGHDAHLNDSLQLGANFTRVETKFNFPRYKTTVRSNYYSLYGLYTPSNQNIFTSIIGIYGISDIINFNQIKNTHKAYTSTIQVMLGSNYKLFSTTHIKPMLGLKYSKIREASYLEDNLSIASVKERTIEGILGVKLANSNTLKSVIITPEIYAFAHKNIKSKIPSAQTNIIDNRILPIYIRKLPLSFSYGAKLSLKTKSIEIGINYNGTKANKFISHLGSINFKINL
ncbi:autotransporter outer membrane beta-barrel domain-containing protein [Rickettsia bellii]|uniref:Outer membrane autotransporter barrel domain protein n=2 Tax=Rickettsia bellii TaxID=33990 RepID=A0A0F3QF73_RICBE|nr:autotransporter outer membrane beta-barrel domain-containing protein [Rickettsia bellii]KJV90064.1 outer membrane autotransporter barrel domain protein [Rickettsia bellii str. RML An4]